MNSGDRSVVPNSVQFGVGQSSQAIDAHYYNITDAESWPVAGLLVLLDGKGQPVRAELHLYDELPSHVQEGAVRQSREVLRGRYPGDFSLPLRVLQTSQMRDAVEVRLGDGELRPAGDKRRPPVPLFAVLGTAAVVTIVVIAAWALRGSQVSAPIDLAGSNGARTPVVAVQETESAQTTASEDQVVEAGPQSAMSQSRNARPDLSVGMRVAIVPGLRLTLRSEPGAEAGVPLGYMMDDDTAVIVGGPELTEGVTDMIVWWLVSLDDGTEAWAAANTSDQTLLIPAQ
jgi:hypothetical protein